MTLRPGSLVLIPFPFSDLQSSKKRPVLVLTEPDGYGDFIALAVTSQAHHTNTVALTQARMQQGTLPKPSWIRTDKVFTLNSRLAIKELGAVSDTVREEALKRLFQKLQYPGASPIKD